MGERGSGYERDEHDWYVEPEWAVEALKSAIEFKRTVHDPCCGSGTIPRVFGGTGADIVDRGFGFPVMDFRQDEAMYFNVVTNPPYRLTMEVIRWGLMAAMDRLAVLVPLNFLASQKRHALFTKHPPERVLVLSRRPSMPPGKLLQEQGEVIRGNGSIDFCWIVWGTPGLFTRIDWIK